MDLEGWRKLFGKSQDDPAVKAALAHAGVKKVPKRDKDDTDVRFDVKGHGVTLVLTDEAFLKQLEDQELGEGPLIVSGVLANLDKAYSRDLYEGPLPYKIKADMAQAGVRKTLGRPTSQNEKFRVDVWEKDGVEVIVSYSKDLNAMLTFGLMLPGAE